MNKIRFDKFNEKDIIALYKKISIYDPKLGVKLLLKFIEYCNNNTMAIHELSNYYIKNKEYDKALSILNESLEYNFNKWTIYRYADLLFKMNFHDKALKICNNIDLPDEMTTVDILINILKVDIHLDRCEYQEAEFCLEVFNDIDKNFEIYINGRREYIRVKKIFDNIEDSFEIEKNIPSAIEERQYLYAMAMSIHCLQINPDRKVPFQYISKILELIDKRPEAGIALHGRVPAYVYTCLGIRVDNYNENNTDGIVTVFLNDDFQQENISIEANKTHWKIIGNHCVDSFERFSFETAFEYKEVYEKNIYFNNEEMIIFEKESNRIVNSNDINRNYYPLVKGVVLKLDITKIEDSVVIFHGKGMVPNYFHTLVDFLPTLYKLIVNGVVPENSKIYFPGKIDKQFQKELFSMMDLKLKIIEYKGALYAKKAIIVGRQYKSMKGEFRITSSERRFFYNFLLDKVKKIYRNDIDKFNSYNKIYITRKDAGNRLLKGEEEISIELKKRGYKIINMSDYSVAEQMLIFNRARNIISVHGAALANLVFCEKETKILEIFHPDYMPMMYYSISMKIGLKYFYYIADTENGGKFKINPKHSRSNIDIDKHHFLDFVDNNFEGNE
jgi:capsular polysaccharide biosynthesis protein